MSLATASITMALPYLPIGAKLGLSPLPPTLLAFMLGIAVLYGVVVEGTKRRFFKTATL